MQLVCLYRQDGFVQACHRVSTFSLLLIGSVVDARRSCHAELVAIVPTATPGKCGMLSPIDPMSQFSWAPLWVPFRGQSYATQHKHNADW